MPPPTNCLFAIALSSGAAARRTGRQVDKQTGRQAGKQAGRQAADKTACTRLATRARTKRSPERVCTAYAAGAVSPDSHPLRRAKVACATDSSRAHDFYPAAAGTRCRWHLNTRGDYTHTRDSIVSSFVLWSIARKTFTASFAATAAARTRTRNVTSKRRIKHGNALLQNGRAHHHNHRRRRRRSPDSPWASPPAGCSKQPARQNVIEQHCLGSEFPVWFRFFFIFSSLCYLAEKITLLHSTECVTTLHGSESTADTSQSTKT